MPFGDPTSLTEIAEDMLHSYICLSEILEVNDITEAEALEILIAGGHIDYEIFKREKEEES